MWRITRRDGPALTERSMCFGLTLVAVLGAAWVLQPVALPTPFQSDIRAAASALGDRKFDAAWMAARHALERQPASPSALLLAGSAAAGRFGDLSAIELFERIPSGAPQALWAELGAARSWTRLGKVARAE